MLWPRKPRCGSSAGSGGSRASHQGAQLRPCVFSLLKALPLLSSDAERGGDGDGLQLAVSQSGAKKWILRFLWQGRPREMGLGSFPEVGLAEAARGRCRAAGLPATASTLSQHARAKAFQPLGSLPIKWRAIWPTASATRSTRRSG
ncbi:MAG TPA: Arm DNA-binding domain-containing protein [Roseiarcus sp.]|nr:Arm DNA-binding domain-containing protein [Roseiarcus sp.]